MNKEEENLREYIKYLSIHEAALDAIEDGYRSCEQNYKDINEKIEMAKQQIKAPTLSEHLEMQYEDSLKEGNARIPETTKEYSQDQIIELFRQINEVTQKLNEAYDSGIQSLIEELNAEENHSNEISSEYTQEKEDRLILQELGIDLNDF